MSKSTEYISNTMSLREPLKQSLELLENLLTKTDLIGKTELTKPETLIKKEGSVWEELE